MTQKTNDFIKLVTTMLTAFMFFLGTIGYTFEKFNLQSIEAFGIFLAALIPFGYVLYGIWMNTFTRWKAFRLADEKKQKRLVDERGK